jgi:hypothetical protein
VLDREPGLLRIPQCQRAVRAQLHAEHGRRQASAPGEQAACRAAIADRAFEELTSDPEAEPALQLAAASR